MSDRRPSNRRYLKPGKHERRGRHEAPPPFTARQYLVAVTSMWLDFKMLTEREAT